jgi:transposase
MESWF